MSDQLKNTIPVPGGFVDAISHASSVDTVMSVGTEWVPRILATERCAICVFDDSKILQKVYRLDGVQEPERERTRYDERSPHRQVLAAGEPAFDDFDDLDRW